MAGIACGRLEEFVIKNVALISMFVAGVLAEDYWLPHVVDDGDVSTVIRLVNAGPESNQVWITGFGAEAAAFEIPSLQLDPMAALCVDLDDLFGGNASRVHWIAFHSDEPLLVIAEIISPGTTSAYWASSALERQLTMPHVAKNTTTFATTLATINGTDTPVTATLQPRPLGAEHNLSGLTAAFGKDIHDVLDYWSRLDDINWVHISADTIGLASMEYFTYNLEQRMAAIRLSGDSGKTIRFLHVATDTANFWTGMVYLNISSANADVTETYFDSFGSIIKEFTPAVLAPDEKVTLLFDANTHDRVPVGTAWIEVRATQDLAGYELFGSVPGGADQTFVGLQGSFIGGTGLDYPCVATRTGMWTGVVAVNIGDEKADISFDLYSCDGTLLAQHSATDIAPKQKVTALKSHMFPQVSQGAGAWIQARADGSQWAGFVLWGDQGDPNRQFLCGVNARVAQPESTSVLLPETRGGIKVWADQLEYDFSNQGINRFVAENFVGSQKLTKNKSDAIRAYNPNFIVVQYHPAFGSGLVNNITGPNTWSQDVGELRRFVAEHPEYGDEENNYMHWTENIDPDHRVAHYWEGTLEWYLANLSFAGWQDYVITETIRRADEIGFNGTFFDVSYEPLWGYEPEGWYEYPPLSWTSLDQVASGWNAIVGPYYRNIREAYHADGRNLLCLPNCDRMITGWYEPEYMAEVDGGMVESWFTGFPDEGDWELSASRILRTITGPGKVLIAQPHGGDDIAQRTWWVGNYFLLKSQTSYFYYAYASQPFWWAEYDIDIGEFVRMPPHDLADLRHASGVYVREYTQGLVLVNPSDTARSYPLDRTYREVTFSGYGEITGNFKPQVSVGLGTQHTGSITVPARSAIILSTAQ